MAFVPTADPLHRFFKLPIVSRSWLYSSNVGQYFARSNEDKVRPTDVRETFPLAPIWVLGRSYTFKRPPPSPGDDGAPAPRISLASINFGPGQRPALAETAPPPSSSSPPPTSAAAPAAAPGPAAGEPGAVTVRPPVKR